MSRLLGRLRKLERAMVRLARNEAQPPSLSDEEMSDRLRGFAERVAAHERWGIPLDPEDSELCGKLQDLAERIRQRKQAELRPDARGSDRRADSQV
jgi:hypothetical protein